MSNPLINNAVQETMAMSNPLLAGMFKMPGRVFPLPSRALLYTAGKEVNAEVKDNGGEIHVRPMSAMAELKLKNPDLLYSGTAIAEVIRECVPEILDPLSLFALDVDAILVYIRAVTYGDTYEVDAAHTCKDAKPHTYEISLDELISRTSFLSEADLMSWRISDFHVGITNRTYDVLLEPIRMRGLIAYQQLGRKDPAEIDTADYQDLVVTNLVHFIRSIDGITSRDIIVPFLQKISYPEIHQLQDRIAQANMFGIPLTKQVGCPECTAAFDVRVEINPTLFFSR